MGGERHQRAREGWEGSAAGLLSCPGAQAYDSCVELLEGLQHSIKTDRALRCLDQEVGAFF